jgi:hypothetical protein
MEPVSNEDLVRYFSPPDRAPANDAERKLRDVFAGAAGRVNVILPDGDAKAEVIDRLHNAMNCAVESVQPVDPATDEGGPPDAAAATEVVNEVADAAGAPADPPTPAPPAGGASASGATTAGGEPSGSADGDAAPPPPPGVLPGAPQP